MEEDFKMKNITIIGLGYIGLPTSVIFAKHGWNVLGVDNNKTIVEDLKQAKTFIEEPGLQEALTEVVSLNRFNASIHPKESEVFMIAVSTPQNMDNSANLRNVISATKSIIPYLKKGDLIILESTVPPRTTIDIIGEMIVNAGFALGKDIYLSFCPERVLPGDILNELVYNNRIIGGINEKSTLKTLKVYETFVKGKLIETDSVSAEMSKLMENTYRDVNIALANELVKISETIEIDPLEVISLANEHPRVNIHQPGPGVGGHCIAVDPYFIIEKDIKHSQLIQNAREINESMPMFIVEKVRSIVPISGIITVLGLAYKGNVDDDRNSPSYEIIKELETLGYEVKVTDPYVKETNGVEVLLLEEAMENSDLLLILTDHKEYKSLGNMNLDKIMRTPVILDTKNIVNKIENTKTKYINFSSMHKEKILEKTANY